jgi:hypothetical protein
MNLSFNYKGLWSVLAENLTEKSAAENSENLKSFVWCGLKKFSRTCTDQNNTTANR